MNSLQDHKIAHRRAWPSLAILCLALTTSCGSGSAWKAASRQRGAEQTARKADDAVIAARDWKESRLDFLTPGFNGSPHALPPQPTLPLKGLGPFRLGMTVDEVRRAARSANLTGFGGQRGGWCKAPTTGGPDFGVVIGKPTDNYGSLCVVGKSCASYGLTYAPIGSILRLAAVEYSRDKVSKSVVMDERTRNSLIKEAGGVSLTSCEVSEKEYEAIDRYELFENNVLQDVLHDPIFLEDKLPPSVRLAAQRWEKSVEVLPIADCCDIYSRSASFNGAWPFDAGYALSYDIFENGEVAQNTDYLVVFDPAGKLLWNGYPTDFKKAGMKAKRIDLRR